MADVLTWVGLIALGMVVAAYGTLVGAGGGFILAPMLLFLYPDLDSPVITALSLGVVWVNAISGSLAYARQKRIDYLAGGVFSAATVPGAFAGALATRLFPRDSFEFLFGAFLLAIAAWLLLPRPARILTAPPPARYLRRLQTDSQGDTYRYAFDPVLGALIGLAIGFVSSLFGVGGGIIFVPAMILVLRFPGYIATATSTFILVFTAGAGMLVHLLAGEYSGLLAEEICLGAGVLLGAQLGAQLSLRLGGRHERFIAPLLSASLLVVGLRLLAGSFL